MNPTNRLHIACETKDIIEPFVGQKQSGEFCQIRASFLQPISFEPSIFPKPFHCLDKQDRGQATLSLLLAAICLKMEFYHWFFYPPRQAQPPKRLFMPFNFRVSHIVRGYQMVFQPQPCSKDCTKINPWFLCWQGLPKVCLRWSYFVGKDLK